jgi:glutaredoxin
VKAKSLLTAKNIPFATISLEDDEQRFEFLATLQGWRTFPVIFELDPTEKPIRFVGGFDALHKELG